MPVMPDRLGRLSSCRDGADPSSGVLRSCCRGLVANFGGGFVIVGPSTSDVASAGEPEQQHEHPQYGDGGECPTRGDTELDERNVHSSCYDLTTCHHENESEKQFYRPDKGPHDLLPESRQALDEKAGHDMVVLPVCRCGAEHDRPGEQ